MRFMGGYLYKLREDNRLRKIAFRHYVSRLAGQVCLGPACK